MNDLRRLADRHWIAIVGVIFLAAATYLIWVKWGAIQRFGLTDTDDNMRMSQVRVWLGGQGWYDLRQYKMDPPGGANIHWSRVVDLPIAGLILIARPFLGFFGAEKFAAALAPLIPLALTMFAMAVTTRRLVSPLAVLLAPVLLICGASALSMFSPLRVDHHGWQLTCLAWTIAGIADRDRVRGGVTAGLASALSLTIGLELLPYVAMAAAATALRWALDREDAPRLTAYGAALAAGSAAGFMLFASYANRPPVCDALSPVWLSVALLGGGLLVFISRLSVPHPGVRLTLAVVVGLTVAGFYVALWPHCVGMLEGISPKLKRDWFDHVREARPLYVQDWRRIVTLLVMPLLGLAGAALSAWRRRGSPDFIPWAVVALWTLCSLLLLLWQMRAAASAQVLAIPGVTALAFLVVPWIMRADVMVVRVLGVAAVFALLSGTAVNLVIDRIPAKPVGETRKKVNLANRRCPTLSALRPIAKLPAQTVLTFVDFGPRLITVTHHRAIAGPYHRNGEAILDVQRAFRGNSEDALAIARKHGATLLLICPYYSESTIYAKENPKGFYRQLMRGDVPGWLSPVDLPKNSPFKAWRIAPSI
ncbi:AcrB/AcrD/AcrF family protein [Sphingomonas sp. ID0503]|uniref:AcrB/AcrD/AcrF family protein n=1 Tax=Sphingomonas sp. ID0503 TaxID=3399691 RepID=UPI003AFB6F2E